MLPSILKNRKRESHPTHVRSSTLGRAVVVDTRRSRSNTTTNSHFSADAACLISPLNPRLVFQIHHISSKAFFILQPPPSTTTEYAAYLTCHHHYFYSAPLSLFPLSPSLPPPPFPLIVKLSPSHTQFSSVYFALNFSVRSSQLCSFPSRTKLPHYYLRPHPACILSLYSLCNY